MNDIAEEFADLALNNNHSFIVVVHYVIKYFHSNTNLIEIRYLLDIFDYFIGNILKSNDILQLQLTNQRTIVKSIDQSDNSSEHMIRLNLHKVWSE